MNKDILLQCVKSLSNNRDKFIVDIIDIKEIEGHGWDYTLVFRYKENPFDINETSPHNFIRKEVYEEFESEYNAAEEARNKKLVEVRELKNRLMDARKRYDDFIQNHTVGDGEIPEIRIDTGNIEEYQQINTDLKHAQEQYTDAIKELSKL